MNYTINEEAVARLAVNYPDVDKLPELSLYFTCFSEWEHLNAPFLEDVTKKGRPLSGIGGTLSGYFLRPNNTISKKLVVAFHCGAQFDEFDPNFDFKRFGEGGIANYSQNRYYFSFIPLLEYCNITMVGGKPARLYRVVLDLEEVDSYGGMASGAEIRVTDASQITILDSIDIAEDMLAEYFVRVRGMAEEEVSKSFSERKKGPAIRKDLMRLLAEKPLIEFPLFDVKTAFEKLSPSDEVTSSIESGLRLYAIAGDREALDSTLEQVSQNIDSYIKRRGSQPLDEDLYEVYSLARAPAVQLGKALIEHGYFEDLADMYLEEAALLNNVDATMRERNEKRMCEYYAEQAKSTENEVLNFLSTYGDIGDYRDMVLNVWLTYPVWSVDGFIMMFADILAGSRPYRIVNAPSGVGIFPIEEVLKTYTLGDPCEVPMFMLRPSQMRQEEDFFVELLADSPRFTEYRDYLRRSGKSKYVDPKRDFKLRVVESLDSHLFSIRELFHILDRIPDIELAIRVREAQGGLPDWYSGYHRIPQSLKQFMQDMCELD